ncbi:MAG: SBBP repeat-containing protein [Patescibacteria group bacterium]|nr:SBBP repeat-containing protein [Patescibacteria group bacterium]
MYFFKKILSTTAILLILTLSVVPNISQAQERPFSNRHGHFRFSPEMIEDREETKRTNETEATTPIEDIVVEESDELSSAEATADKEETQVDNITREIQSTPLSTPSTQTDDTVWDTKEDFNKGINNNTSSNQFDGDVTLEYQSPSESYTETTKEQFDLGRNDFTELYTSAVDNQDDGEVIINQGWTYTSETSPGSISDSIIHSFVDINNKLIYISTYSGLSVINTQGTIDPSDDTLVTTYNTTSTPAIANNRVYHSFLDTANNLIYISTVDGGLSVINTQGTIDPSDDTLVTTYNTTSTPAIAGNIVFYSSLDANHNILYVGTRDGLSVINTQGTIDPSDDTLVTTYNTTSTPAIANNWIYEIFLDAENNLIYISTWGSGISVINTHGTIDPSDDTLVITYNTTSTPAIANNRAKGVLGDSDNNLIYINTEKGLSVINTHGTIDPSDDTLVITYNTTSTPAIANNSVTHTFLDVAHDYLYISTFGGGVSVINTHGTIDPSDDTLVTTYNTTSTPEIVNNNITHTFLDLTNNLMYASAWGNGLSVINLNKTYNKESTYISVSQNINTSSTEHITWDRVITNEQELSLQYRTGNANAFWQNDFDDDDPSEYAGDFYGWGSEFQDATESNGTMKLSNPNPHIWNDDQYVDFWIDTGMPDGHFPAGSVVVARVRVNSDREQSTYGDYVFTDDWWDDESYWENNEWKIVRINTNSYNHDFSKIGFEISWKTGTWDNVNDTFEIDWLQIELPDSHWNSWSNECTDNTNCPIDQNDLIGNEYIQYKLNLETGNSNTTPKINSVTYANNYNNTGTYTSNKINFNETTYLNTFNVDQTVPNNTNINYEYSIDNGDSWNTINPNENFPDNTKTNNFQWKAFFTSSNTKTPQIHKVTLNSDKANTTKEVIETIPECECYEMNSADIPDNATISYSNNDKQDFNYTPQPDRYNKDCDITDIKITYNNTTSITGEDTIQEFLGNFTDTRVIDEGNGKVVLDGVDRGTYTMGGISWDAGWGVAVDFLGNIYITGEFENTVNFDTTGGTDEHTAGGMWDAFITKYNADGSYAWTRTIGATGGGTWGMGIATDSSGSVYATGSFSNTVNFDTTGGIDEYTSNGGYDIFITKYNTDGSYVWTKTVGDVGADYGYSITTSQNGDIFVTGQFMNTVDFDPSAAVDSHTSNGSCDIFITKYNADGSYAWTKTVGGINYDTGSSIAINQNGDIFATGSFRDTVDFDPSAAVDSYTSNGDHDIFITKYNTDGLYVWTRTFGSAGWDGGDGITIDSVGNLYTTGSFSNTVNFDDTGGTDEYTSNGGYDIFITKYNANGSYVWTRTFGGTDLYDYGNSIATDTNNNIYVVGGFWETVNFNTTGGIDEHISNGDSDIYITKYNTDGSYVWTRTFGGTGWDDGYGIALNESNIYITGFFESPTMNFDGTGGTDEHAIDGIGSIFLTKYNKDGSYGTLSTTYKPNGIYQTKINSQGTLKQWKELNLTRELENSTNLTVEVLDESCTTTLINETSNTTIDLSNIDISNTSLCLKTNFTTSDLLKTPKLDKWEVSYQAQTDNTDTSFTYKTQEDPKCEKIDECSFEKVKNITENSVDLRVSVDKKYRKDKQKFKVKVENLDTGDKETIKLKDTPSDNGMVTLNINNLNQNTNYRFKVDHRVDDSYEYCPHSKEAKTDKTVMGPAQNTTTDTTTDISDPPSSKTTENEEENTPPIKAGTTNPSSEQTDTSIEHPIEHPTESSTNELATLIPQTLGLVAIALSAIPLFPLPLQTSLLMLFAIPFIKRKKEKFWGIVFDSHTKQPIKNTVVYLIDTKSNEKLETVLTDEQGRYGFLISKPSNYTIEVKKGSYTISTKSNNDPIYGKTYTHPQEFKPDTPIELNISLQQQKVNWDNYVQGISKKIILKTLWNILLYIIFAAGFIYTIYTTLNYPHWINYAVLSIYAITTIFLIVKKSRKHYGTVTSKETKTPIPFTLIELYKNDQRVHFTVTDIQGRYYLLAQDGTYTMKVKGQPAGGHIFEKHGDITVTKGIVKEDIEI